jgi:hypothetical protein
MTSNRREHLPNRRASVAFDFELGGLRFTCTTSNFADGRVGEVFLDNHKAGSQVGAIVRDAAVASSLALQFGCPLDTLRGAVLRNPDNTAASPLGKALDIVGDPGARKP